MIITCIFILFFFILINIQAAASLMKDQKLKGSIVNISSIGATNGAATHSHYCASKAGVIGYTKTMAQEFGPFGIRVNAVLPGVINTPMVERNGGDEVLNFFFHFVSIMVFHSPDATLFV